MPEPKKYVGKRGVVTWRVRFRLDKQQLQESFDSKRDADAFCADITTRDARYALRMLHEREKPQTGTLDEIAEAYFTWKAGKVRSDRSVADYRRDYENWIKPTLGARPAGAIDEADVQAWVDGLADGSITKPARDGQRPRHAPLAAKTVGDRHALLHGIYDFALQPKRRLVDHNPCTATELPKKQKRPPRGLMPAEWVALHRAMVQIDPDGADLAEFLLASGWRISEAAAVTAWDVEDYGEQMYVSMGHVLRRNAAGQYVVVDEGKGEASLRRIQLDAAAAAMVRRRLQNVTDGGLVFTTRTGHQWHTDNFRTRIWRPAVKAAGLSRKPTPHWLRHTAVFWLARSGASLPDLQSRIGHASIKTTIDTYGRMLQDVAPAALEGFAAMRGAPQQLDS